MYKLLKVTQVLFAAALFAFPAVTKAEPLKFETKVLTSEKDVIKAMTFNVRVDTIFDILGNRWSSRRKIAINTIRKSNPDVVGLQESRFKQVKDIHDGLPGYKCYSAGRNDGNKKGESCAILFRDDRFKMIDYGTFWFSDTPDKPGTKGWGNIPPRICSWVRLGDITAGNEFYVYNVHLDHLSQRSRRKSTQLLAQEIADRETDDPFIILGDFNMKIDNPAMQYLCNGDIKDAWSTVFPAKQKGTGTRHGFDGSVNGPRIDHIPVCNTLDVLAVEIDRHNRNGKYPSDHFPVVATIRFKDESGVNENTERIAKSELDNPEVQKN